MSSSTKSVVIWQRFEGSLILLASILAYQETGESNIKFIAFILIVDIFMIGYLRNAKIGAFIYNLGHNLGLPILLLAISYSSSWSGPIVASLIWLAHVGMDRLWGYGLKLPTSFKDTHLGKIN